MSNYYISDLHLFHNNVTKAGKNFDNRPFNNLDEMHEAIKSNWNKTITNADHVYILGDLAWRVTDETIAYISTLKGSKHLILGNHDRNITDGRYRQLFNEIVSYKELQDTANGVNYKVTLSHYFMPFYNGYYHNGILLHGHSHITPEADEELRIAKELNDKGFANQIYNVGCMYPYMDYTPRTLKEIIVEGTKWKIVQQMY